MPRKINAAQLMILGHCYTRRKPSMMWFKKRSQADDKGMKIGKIKIGKMEVLIWTRKFVMRKPRNLHDMNILFYILRAFWRPFQIPQEWPFRSLLSQWKAFLYYISLTKVKLPVSPPPENRFITRWIWEVSRLVSRF